MFVHRTCMLGNKAIPEHGNRCPLSHGVFCSLCAGHFAQQPGASEGGGQKRNAHASDTAPNHVVAGTGRCWPWWPRPQGSVKMVALHGFLRTRDARISSLAFLSCRKIHACCALLPVTKTGQRHQSAPETVMLTDPVLCQYSAALLTSIQPWQRLYTHSGTFFGSSFQDSSTQRDCLTPSGNRRRGNRPFSGVILHQWLLDPSRICGGPPFRVLGGYTRPGAGPLRAPAVPSSDGRWDGVPLNSGRRQRFPRRMASKVPSNDGFAQVGGTYEPPARGDNRALVAQWESRTK